MGVECGGGGADDFEAVEEISDVLFVGLDDGWRVFFIGACGDDAAELLVACGGRAPEEEGN